MRALHIWTWNMDGFSGKLVHHGCAASGDLGL
jgi:hypothetical protein